MAGAKVKNPRKKFLWQIIFVKHPINAFLFQKVGIPEISIEQVSHGDVNYDVKTGRPGICGKPNCFKVGNNFGL